LLDAPAESVLEFPATKLPQATALDSRTTAMCEEIEVTRLPHGEVCRGGSIGLAERARAVDFLSRECSKRV
jgi:hypothetical protein